MVMKASRAPSIPAQTLCSTPAPARAAESGSIPLQAWPDGPCLLPSQSLPQVQDSASAYHFIHGGAWDCCWRLGLLQCPLCTAHVGYWDGPYYPALLGPLIDTPHPWPQGSACPWGTLRGLLAESEERKSTYFHSAGEKLSDAHS